MNNKNLILKRVRAEKSYLFKENKEYESEISNIQTRNCALENTATYLKNQLVNSKQFKIDVTEENEYLRLLINDNEQKKLNLYDEHHRSYTKETQECVYELLNNNVTTSRVGPVIKSVLNVLDYKADKVPSTSTVNNMNVQRLTCMLAQKHVSEI